MVSGDFLTRLNDPIFSDQLGTINTEYIIYLLIEYTLSIWCANRLHWPWKETPVLCKYIQKYRYNFIMFML